MAKHLTTRSYVLTWVVLVALTVLTFGLSRVLRGAWEVPVALGIATAKAALVSIVFMHLAEARFATRLMLVVAVLYVAILISLMLGDVLARDRPVLLPPAIEALR